MLINIEISSSCWSEENYAELLQVLHNKEMDFFLKHLCPRGKKPIATEFLILSPRQLCNMLVELGS